MRNILSVIIIVILLTLVGGCQSKPIGDSYALINTTTLHPSNTVPSNIILPDSKEKGGISHYDTIEGWEELTAKVFVNELTYHRDQRVLTQMEENQMVEYSIELPDSWTLDYTVLNEGTEHKKVGELLPVFLMKPNEESEFLEFEIPEEYTETELLSIEMVTFGEYKGLKIILEVTKSETWYPYTYYLTDGTYVFGITLYSYSLNRDETEQKLFDDIVSTFRFIS